MIGISQVIGAVATCARQQLFSGGVRDRTHVDVFVSNLIDMLLGAITAPVSSATLAAMEAEVAPGEVVR